MSSAWTNAYTPPSLPSSEDDLYGPKDKPYDLNFCFPLLPSEHLDPLTGTLSNPDTHVRLTPFIPRVHAARLYATCAANPELFDWLPIACPGSLEAFVAVLGTIFQSDPANLLFVVMVPATSTTVAGNKNPDPEKEEEWQIAGTMGLIHTSTQQLSTELALALTLPAFQRTHVTSNAIGLALRYCLNLPSSPSTPGLGLRRVQWQANPLNVASVRAAERMGFKKEGVHRWVWPLPPGRSGHEPREGDPMKECKGRDSVFLSVCCDDWENGGRERVEEAMRIRHV